MIDEAVGDEVGGEAATGAGGDPAVAQERAAQHGEVPTRTDDAVRERAWLVDRAVIEIAQRSDDVARGADRLLAVAFLRDPEPDREVGQDHETLRDGAELERSRGQPGEQGIEILGDRGQRAGDVVANLLHPRIMP